MAAPSTSSTSNRTKYDHPPPHITIIPREQRTKRSGSWQEDERWELVKLVMRFQRLPAASQKKNRCSDEPDIPWTEVSKQLLFRTAKQCRERWDNHEKFIVANRKLPPISREEGEWILEQVKTHGKRWAHFGRLLDRPENSLKNWYYQEDKKTMGRAARVQEKKVDAMRQQHRDRRALIRSSKSRGSFAPNQTQSGIPPAMVASYQQLAAIRPLASDQFPLPQQDGYSRPSYHSILPPVMHSRRQSTVSNPPSLASDHDSIADSPRSIAEPMLSSSSQFQLPTLYPAKFSPKMEESWGVNLNRYDRSASTASQSCHIPAPYTPRFEVPPISPGFLYERERIDSNTYRPEQPSAGQGGSMLWSNYDSPSRDRRSEGFTTQQPPRPHDIHPSEHNSTGVNSSYWAMGIVHPVPAQTDRAPAPQALTVRDKPRALEPNQSSSAAKYLRDSKLSLDQILNL